MIVYKSVKKTNPRTGETAYYASQVRMGHVSIDELAEDMAQESTITRHDILAVLSSLQQHVIKYLRQGKSVRLGDLGSFSVSIGSRPSGSEEEVSANNIKDVRVRFRRSSKMLHQLRATNPQVHFST